MINRDHRLKHTKTSNLTEVPTNPVIIQCVMPCTWCHFSDTWCKCISWRPGSLNFFSTCPPSPFCIPQAKILLAPLSMPIYMPAWDTNFNFCGGVDLHILRKVRHPSLKVLWPLTANIIGDENPGEDTTNKCRKDDKVHITIPKGQRISFGIML